VPLVEVVALALLAEVVLGRVPSSSGRVTDQRRGWSCRRGEVRPKVIAGQGRGLLTGLPSGSSISCDRGVSSRSVSLEPSTELRGECVRVRARRSSRLPRWLPCASADRSIEYRDSWSWRTWPPGLPTLGDRKRSRGWDRFDESSWSGVSWCSRRSCRDADGACRVAGHGRASKKVVVAPAVVLDPVDARQ
jgi:hypothetical protein